MGEKHQFTTKTCHICGHKTQQLKKHWRKCHSEIPWEEYLYDYHGRPVCKQCGKEIHSWNPGEHHDFCSLSCSYRYRQEHDYGPASRVERECPICGEKFKSINGHLRRFHPEVSLEKFAYLLNGYEDIPTCKYCGKPLGVLDNGFVLKTCGDPDCEHEMRMDDFRNRMENDTFFGGREKRVEVSKRNARKLAEEGRSFGGKEVSAVYAEKGRISQGINGTNFTCVKHRGQPNNLYVLVAEKDNRKLVKVGVALNVDARFDRFINQGYQLIESQVYTGVTEEVYRIETTLHHSGEFQKAYPNAKSDKSGITEWYDFSERDKIINYLKDEFNVTLENHEVKCG